MPKANGKARALTPAKMIELTGEAQAQHRYKIASAHLITRVMKSVTELDALDSKLKSDRNLTSTNIQRSMTRIAAIRTATDIRLKLINKYLPDIKAIDLAISDADEATKATALRALLGEMIEVSDPSPANGEG